MKKILFVAFSHTLTETQIDGFKQQFGEAVETEKGYLSEEEAYANGDFMWSTYTRYIAKITNLGEVSPGLQKQFSNVSPLATLSEIQAFACAIVLKAVEAGATHFFCVGEPTLCMWANLYASGQASYDANSLPHSFLGMSFLNTPERGHVSPKMTCVQSTTERVSVDTTQPDGSVLKTAVFQHVQWRKMF